MAEITTNENTEELSKGQLARLDDVHNAVFALVNELVPVKYRRNGDNDEDNQFDWQTEWIDELSDHVQEITAKLLEIPENDREAFDMEFAPFFYSEQ